MSISGTMVNHGGKGGTSTILPKPQSKSGVDGLLQKSASAVEAGKRSPIRSRIAVAQDSCSSSRMEKQRQGNVGSSNGPAGVAPDGKPTQSRVSGLRPLSQLESISKPGGLHEGRFKIKKAGSPTKETLPRRMTSSDTPLEPPAFEEEKRTANRQNDAAPSNRGNVAVHPIQRRNTGSLEQTTAASTAQVHTAKAAVMQLRQLSAGKTDSRNAIAGAVPSADALTKSPPAQDVDLEPRVMKPAGAADHRNSGETRNSGSRPSVTRAGYVLDPHAGGADAVTTETRDSISRSRLSAQVLRGILGSSEKRTVGTPGRQANSTAISSSTGGANDVNPLHRMSRVSATSDAGNDVEVLHHSDYEYEDHASFSQSSSGQIDVHAGELGTYGGAGNYDGADTYVDEESFANRRGELEWLRTPSLFYFFANVIKWNELQVQRKTLMASLQAHQQRSNHGSLSLVSVWTQHRERELRTLEAQISFSAFELEGVYLNRLLMRWSKPKLRSLVTDVVVTWKKEGPSSAKFDRVSSRLFDAISSEEACQLRCTWVFSLRQWLGLPLHRWIVTGIMVGCFIVAILCIVFLAVFGRTREAVCIALSAVLGVAVIVMYVVAMFILHHNTYASAAATYFREAAVRAAQRTMEEEEDLGDGDNLSEIDSYLEPNEVKYGGAVGRGPGNTNNNNTTMYANNSDAETRSDYTEEQILLAVRGLRALTEGTPQPAEPGAPYHRIPSNMQGGRRESGTAAGGYYDDDMTLTDDNMPSLTSRPLQVIDAAKQKQDLDRDNTLLLSTVTYEQHQEYLQQRQSLLVQETMGASKGRNGRTGGPREDHFAAHVESVAEASDTKRADGGADVPAGLRQLADLPDKVNITALIYCNNAGVLSAVAPSLWERMFMVLRVAELRALDNAFKHGSERFKVILIYAPDAPDGSEVLRTALTWLQVERRPVFFLSRQTDGYAYQVPQSARLKVPFTSSAINTLLLAGIGVEAELGSVSFPALVQQEQSPSQPFQVPPYVLGRRLGGGAFGNVFEAEMEQSGAKCAVKRMYLKEDSEDGQSSPTANASANGELKLSPGGTNQTSSSAIGEGAGETASNADGGDGNNNNNNTGVGSQLREIAQEVEIMSSLQHPNIVRYYFCERDDNCISIFMELCTGGSLSSLIHSGKLVHPAEIKLVLREIVSAVAYLHSLRIVHRDLKPDNVLFRQGHAKITDFGTAVHKHGGDLRLIKGTFAYMAPETLVGEPYGSACDVWSIGCIAAEVLGVELPQHALGLPAMCEFYRTMQKGSTLAIDCDVAGVRDFLLACLRRDPTERSTAAELFYHPILQARENSIEAWMQKVVEQRRHKHILQHKMSHRIGPGGRGANGGAGSVHAGTSSRHDSNVNGTAGGDLFDLNSDNGSIISLDSSQLTGHEDDQNSLTSQ